MTAIVDTGPLVAIATPRDPYHERAKQIMMDVLTGRYGAAISLDLVLLEGLTLIQRRTKEKPIAHLFASYFHGAQDRREPLVKTRSSTDLLERAIEIHFQYYDQGLSTVDSALVALAEITKGVLVTFDKNFEGLVPVIEQ